MKLLLSSVSILMFELNSFFLKENFQVLRTSERVDGFEPTSTSVSVLFTAFSIPAVADCALD